MKRICIKLIVINILFFLIFSISFNSQASSLTDATSVLIPMQNTSNPVSPTGDNNKVAEIINTAIGLLQIAGTGIAMIVISILGIKYLLASPSEKADVKKSIMPIVIGCILVFGGVNIMAVLYDFTIATFN